MERKTIRGDIKMREYLADKKKKVILEEYIIENFKGFETEIGMSIVGCDIHSLLQKQGDKTSLSLVYFYQIAPDGSVVNHPIGSGPVDKYSRKTFMLHISDENSLYCILNESGGPDRTGNMLNNILISFSRESKLNKIL